MSSPGVSLPAAIERGLRGLGSISCCVVEDLPRFDAAAKRWVVTLSLRRSAGAPFVGTVTRWCVLIDSAYPFGRVAIYPAAKGGLTATFPHQERNTADGQQRGWRGGKLCLDTPFGGERQLLAIRDPVGDADTRVTWHVERAVDWLERAANERLLATGDPFEVPARPHTTARAWLQRRVVHDETPTALKAWSERSGSFGVAHLGSPTDIGNAIAVARYEDRRGAIIRQWAGRELGQTDINGFWWLLPECIVLPPWQAPSTWGELRRIAKSMALDADAMLRWLFPLLRGATTSSVLLLGYPVPLRVGEPASEVHWDALLLPQLPVAAGKPARGFRPNSLGWWHRDRYGAFADGVPLEHLYAENWSSERLQARGRLSAGARELRVALIGVGALGSSLAEMLVRAGTTDITLVDGDLLAAGNVCRHVATLDDVGKLKVPVVAQRLRQLSPAVRVLELTDALPADAQALGERLEQYDLVIDCTASDEVLALLAAAWWSVPRVFASFSLGYGGKRLFSFGVSGQTFPQEEFNANIQPWLQYEAAAWTSNDEVLEGPGCWSPLFPARADDVVLAAATCVKELEALVARRPRVSRFRVYVQTESAEGFQGFVPEAAPPTIEVEAMAS